MRSFVSAFCLWVGAFGLQIILILWLPSQVEEFTNTRSISGVYQYSKIHTYVDGVPIYCAVSFMGPLESCALSDLNGTKVRVDVAKYKHLFGSGEVVVAIQSGDATVLHYSQDQMKENWRLCCLTSAFFNSVIATGIFILYKKSRQVYG